MAFTKIYQPHALTKIRGSFFRFAPDRSGTIYGDRICIDSDRDRIKAFEENPKQPFLLVVHPTFGRPGSHAYKIWRYLEEQHVARGNYRLHTTPLDLLRACGFKKNSDRYRDQLIALKQLEHTVVFYHSQAFLHTKPPNKRSALKMISVDTVLKADSEKVDSFRIEVSPIISSELKSRRKFYTINADRLGALVPATHCFAVLVCDALTRRYVKYLREKEDGEWYYNKPYPRVCEDWLANTVPHKKHSEAYRKHLEPHLNELIKIELLSPKSTLTQGQLILYPGDGFISDYQQMYVERYSEESEALVKYFGQQYTGNEHRVARPDDYKYATRLITAHGFEPAKAFVYHAVRIAVHKDKWSDIQYFKAIDKYREGYFRQQQEQVIKPANTKTESAPMDPSSLYTEYQAAISPRAIKHYESLTNEQKQRIDESLVTGSETEKFESLLTLLRITANINLPTLEQWQSSKAS